MLCCCSKQRCTIRTYAECQLSVCNQPQSWALLSATPPCEYSQQLHLPPIHRMHTIAVMKTYCHMPENIKSSYMKAIAVAGSNS